MAYANRKFAKEIRVATDLNAEQYEQLLKVVELLESQRATAIREALMLGIQSMISDKTNIASIKQQ